MISFDRDALYGGSAWLRIPTIFSSSASVKLRFVRALALQMDFVIEWKRSNS